MDYKNVVMKTDYDYNWNKCEDKYIPQINTIILYKYSDGKTKMKISDGVHTLKELPFMNDSNTPKVNNGVLDF